VSVTQPAAGPSLPPLASPAHVAPSDTPLVRLQSAIGETVIGSESTVQALTIALACEGHVLLEGLPGLAKTYLVRSFARAVDLGFRRIQFTPDMLPSDIVGNVVLNAKTQSLEFRPGPVFTNILLADEINRAPPKVQSALLEAMQESQVTADGRTYPLPRPFLVIATQNPIEQEGTYSLPEAQLDRFLFRLLLEYPSRPHEVEILTTQGESLGREAPAKVLSPAEIEALHARQLETYVGPDVYQYIADVVRETRNDPRILVGASPRAGVHLLLASRALAVLQERRFVVPDDVRSLAFPVLNHRIILRPEDRRGGRTTDVVGGFAETLREVVRGAVDRVRVPR
jgi:MoxR-like ATPase